MEGEGRGGVVEELRQGSRAVVELPRMCQPECAGVGVEVYKGGGHGGEDADEEYGDLDYGLP